MESATETDERGGMESEGTGPLAAHGGDISTDTSTETAGGLRNLARGGHEGRKIRLGRTFFSKPEAFEGGDA